MLEAIVVCLIALVVLSGALTLLVASGAWGKRGGDQAQGLEDVRLALETMAREVREARQVLYPAAGHPWRAGLGLMNARGEAVFFRLVTAADGQHLVRETVADGRQTVVARDVAKLVVSVADPGGGREPALVRLLVTKSTGQSTDAGVSLFTSASCRAVLTRCLALRDGEP